MKKFVIEYELPYTHIVRVGIQAENEVAAIEVAQRRFDDGTLWDNAPQTPLLYDDFEETDGSSLEFRVVAECDEWPEPDSSVKAIHEDAAAKRACERLIEAFDCSGERRDELLRYALDEARVATGRSSPSAGVVPTVVVLLEGGVVQMVTSSYPVRYMVLDADTDGCDETVNVTMSDGSIEEVAMTPLVDASCDPKWIEQLMQEAKDQR